MIARNPNIRIHAKVAGNHGVIRREDFREVAALDGGGADAEERGEHCQTSQGPE